MTGTLTAATAAGLVVLAGCHSSSGTGAAAAPSSAAVSSSAAAAGSASGTPAAAGSGSGSGATTVGYFPAEVGDTWVYQVSLDGTTGRSPTGCSRWPPSRAAPRSR
jgi:hypothetical protein